MWVIVLAATFVVGGQTHKFHWTSAPVAGYQDQCVEREKAFNQTLFDFATKRLPKKAGVTIETRCELTPLRPA